MPIAPIGPIAPTFGASAVAPATSPTAGGFADVLSGAVDQVQATQGASDTLALKAVTGDLTDIHDATIAAARADVTMQLAATIRNKGVDAFNEIMRMQA
ncbi:flagellar hook-basal body complex protein FliE [Pseudolysinimonas sp.]|uniref:flagellar hook-basal body complex protein FliE n=1 Tax=Pseudolysinimonas sp. TaxID=2680009 RepID=UPI003F7E855A